MKQLKRIFGIVAIIAVVTVVLVKLRSNKQTAEDKVYQFNKEKPITVSTDTVRLESMDATGVYTGTFEPNRETKISADIQGKITGVLVDVGSHVNKGQPLLQLDNSLLKLQLQTVEVQIEGLEDDVKRFTILTQADAVQGVQLEKATLGLKAAQVQKATILEQINKTTVRAPFSGIVTAKLSEAGAFAAPAIPLLQITDISMLRFTVNVPEHDLVHFQVNRVYSISADVYHNIPLSGKLIMTGSKANMGNNFPVQFQVANTKDLAIKSGMFGRVKLSGDKKTLGIFIPSSAIIEENGKAQVYIVKDGKAVIQSVTTSKNIGNKVMVSDGLHENDIIITNGFINLFESANVAVK